MDGTIFRTAEKDTRTRDEQEGLLNNPETQNLGRRDILLGRNTCRVLNPLKEKGARDGENKAMRGEMTGIRGPRGTSKLKLSALLQGHKILCFRGMIYVSRFFIPTILLVVLIDIKLQMGF